MYRQRRQRLLSALILRGVALPDRDGLSIYLPVQSEQFAMITLAARGIAVLPGERCRSGSGQFVRVSTSMLPEHLVDEVADALLIASGREPGAIRSDL
ncbi:hypothetical protein VRB95_15355 [Erwinia aphidicola]|uniref:hypothetical protein n=1 Tax=Erwinia aphidicola TaxID=68334 RepID=UPI0030D1EA51